MLKDTIREPRPSNGILVSLDNDEGTNQYGMPSLHSQLSVFSLVYLYLVTNNIPITILSAFIIILTLYQRWQYRRHTIEQLFVGSIIGGIMGYVIYTIAKNYKK